MSSVGTLWGKDGPNTTHDSQPKKTKANDQMDQDSFMKLLITQMKYQDPISPMDNNAFTQQTTMFSQLQQMIDIHKTVEKLAQAATQSKQADFFMASGAIGKEIEFETNELTISGDKISPISFLAIEKGDEAVIQIYNSSDALVGTIKTSTVSKGDNNISWDGLIDGNKLQDGVYKFTVEAVDKNNKKIITETVGKNIVNGVKMLDGIIYYDTEHGHIPSDKVYSIREREKADS